MDAELHTRSKALFLRARELEREARRALLDEACAGDDALRREVESLLAHDLPGTILASPDAGRASPGAALVPPGGALAARRAASSGAPGLGASPLRTLLRQRRTLVAGLAVLALLLAVGLWTLGRVTAALHGVLADSLTTVLDADVEALQRWVAGEQQFAERWAEDPEVVAQVLALQALAAGRPAAELPDALAAAPALAALRARLMPVLDAHGARAFGVADRSGLVLATSPPRASLDVLGTWLAPEGLAMTARVFGGETVMRMPYVLGSLSNTHSEVSEDRILSVLAPVGDAAGEVLAALVFLLEPDDDFTRILSVARLGESGDTYAFDAGGRMLSHSRFEEQILELHDLEPAAGGAMLRVRLVDPGGDLTAGHDPGRPMEHLPLAPRVAEALAAGAGVDVHGYRDVRGVEVVGAWRWLPEYGIGVATEVEKAEAYRAIADVRTAFRVLLAALLLTLLALLGAALAVGALRARMQRLDRYTLVRPLGEGGMGVVYEAQHALLRRPVALKLIRADKVSPDTLARFEREVQLTASLSHPSTVAVYDYGRTEDGVFYYVMEFLSGLSLAELVRREGALPVGRVVHVLRQACGSLAEAHEAGLVHRDVKPANVMLCRLGGLVDVVKLLDFGLVKDLAEPGRDDVSTPGQVLGTPLYIAPEALADPLLVDARADLYGLGAVAFELLTGQPVFPSERGAGLLSRVLNEPAPPPSSRAGQPIPEGLDRLVQQLLAKDPYARPQSAREVLRRLDALSGYEPWTEEQAREWWAAQGEGAGPPATDGAGAGRQAGLTP